MRTTLKRGIGRRRRLNGNGKATLPPGPLAPVTSTGSRSRRGAAAPRSRCAILGWAAVVVAMLVGRASPAARTCTLHESVAARRAARRRASRRRRSSSTCPLAGQPATALVIGYDRRASEAQGRAVALRHAHAGPRRPARRRRSRCSRSRATCGVEIRCPGKAPFTRQDQRRVLDCGAAGHARRRSARSPACRSTT